MSLSYDVRALPSALVFETLTASQVVARGYSTIDAFLADVGSAWGWTEPGMSSPDYENGRLERSITRMHPRTETLIFAMMFIDMGEITTKNWKEVFTRIYMWERVNGAIRRTAKGDFLFFTPEDVRLHFGLKCNVTEAGKASFNARMANILREGAERMIRAEGGVGG